MRFVQWIVRSVYAVVLFLSAAWAFGALWYDFSIRQRLMEYVATINHMDEKARWYNAVTTNCTTSIRSQHPSSERVPWDWRMPVNGFMDKMLYENHGFIGDEVPFAELKKRVFINAAAKAADADPDFSQRIREGLPKR